MLSSSRSPRDPLGSDYQGQHSKCLLEVDFFSQEKTLMVVGERAEAHTCDGGEGSHPSSCGVGTGQGKRTHGAYISSVRRCSPRGTKALLSQSQEPQSSAWVRAFHRHSLNTHYMPDTVMGGDTARKEAGLLPFLIKFTVHGKHRY